MTSASATITYRTLIDEVRLAMNWKAETNVPYPIMSDAEIKGFIFQNFVTQESTWTLQKYTDNYYALPDTENFGVWIWNPTFDSEAITGTVTGAQSTTVLIDSTATFETDGVTVGQTVSLDVGGETAAVVSIDSETQLTTAALSDSGTYDAGEAYTVINEYTVYARGAIEVTEGKHSTDTIAVTGARVNFPNVMVQILHWLATHRCQEVAQNSLSGSTDPSRVKDELLQMAEYWQGVTGV